MICDDQARNVAQSTSEQLGRGNLTDVTIAYHVRSCVFFCNALGPHVSCVNIEHISFVSYLMQPMQLLRYHVICFILLLAALYFMYKSIN